MQNLDELFKIRAEIKDTKLSIWTMRNLTYFTEFEHHVCLTKLEADHQLFPQNRAQQSTKTAIPLEVMALSREGIPINCLYCYTVYI